MFKKANMFFIKTITPLHAGSGDSLGVIDMPIQRERHTSYPKIEGSSLKGSIREVFEKNIEGVSENDISIVFGPDSDNNKNEHAGAIGFTDARILLFPVKSVKGVFAYVTCPAVINRLKQDLEITKKNVKDVFPEYESNLGNTDEVSYCISASNSPLKIDDSVILEEYSYKIKNGNCDNLAKYLSKEIGDEDIKSKMLVISDDDFKDFVTLSTEVITRTKIDNRTGTVKEGALFTEEYLPAESVMYSLVLASPAFVKKEENKTKIKDENDVMNYFNQIPDIIQIGGNATIGKGIVKIAKGGKQ